LNENIGRTFAICEEVENEERDTRWDSEMGIVDILVFFFLVNPSSEEIQLTPKCVCM